jgi:hypothetical protein
MDVAVGRRFEKFILPTVIRRRGMARNPHARAIVDRQMADPLPLRRKLWTESEVLSLLPYMYSATTSLLAAHPEHCVPVLSDCGHSLLRLARRNYNRPTTSAQTREAITEYISAHLLADN